jgi:TonB family protein
MRRRDASDSSALDDTADTRRPVVVALVVSLGLHAALMAAGAAASLFSARPPTLIQVSLLPGTGQQEPGDVRRDDGAVVRQDSLPQAAEKAPVTAPVLKRPTRPTVRTAHVSAAVNGETQTFGAGTVDESGSPGRPGERGGDAMAQAAGSGSGSGAGTGSGDGFDPRTSCLYCPEPSYPLIARARGWQGIVEVALSVLADGSVDGARLGRSSGYPALDDAAIAVARQSRFRLPRDGLSKPLRGRIEYRFILSSR